MSYRIDQFCINQDSIEEKTYQVSMMTRIYQTARNVFIWLNSEGSRGAFSTLRTLSPACREIMERSGTTFLEFRDQDAWSEKPETIAPTVSSIIQDFEDCLWSLDMSYNDFIGSWIELLAENWWSRA